MKLRQLGHAGRILAILGLCWAMHKEMKSTCTCVCVLFATQSTVPARRDTNDERNYRSAICSSQLSDGSLPHPALRLPRRPAAGLRAVTAWVCLSLETRVLYIHT